MYKAEFRLKLTLPDGTVKERAFEHTDTDLSNLATMFVESVFSRATAVAESMFEALEQELSEQPPPPPTPPPSTERKRGDKRKRKDPVDSPAPAESTEPGGSPAPAVEPGTAETAAPAGETPAGTAAGDRSASA